MCGPARLATTWSPSSAFKGDRQPYHRVSRLKVGMAQIDHIFNSLQKSKNLSQCTDSSLVTVTIVTYEFFELLPVHIHVVAPSKTAVCILNQTLSKIDFSLSFSEGDSILA